jgi:Arc/MetJ-type ribon-helix-helix transcriptional regulator
MDKSRIAVVVDRETLTRLDRLVKSGAFHNRSQAVRDALKRRLHMTDGLRLARECAKLNLDEEKALAEEGITADSAQWPEY